MPDSKVMIVTGAGSGIGYETALYAARQGFGILAVSRHERELYQLSATIAAEGGTCVVLPLDVTSADAPKRIVQTARESFGRIDVLINNAGAATAGRLLEQTDEQIDAQWDLHVAAPLRITRDALPMLQESRGQVMFVGSGLARVPSPYYGAYCAAKAAVRAMTTQLRRELHGTGIAVTYIDPGSVRTNFSKSAGIPSFGPEWAVADADRVARRIVSAARRRPNTLNAVPLHTFGAMLGEWFPHMADRALSQRTPPPVQPTPAPQPQPPPAPQPSLEPVQSDFERALEPVSRRMERVKLAPAFIAELLRPGDDVHLSDAAMRWAGMPNKNERAAMAEVLEALAAGGFLEKTGDESWHVVRSAS
ncbi:MAG TPA: SDR family NAD(P)-dependent oxidoreductase [Candidatus Baltobacteraceae bacterium]